MKKKRYSLYEPGTLVHRSKCDIRTMYLTWQERIVFVCPSLLHRKTFCLHGYFDSDIALIVSCNRITRFPFFQISPLILTLTITREEDTWKDQTDNWKEVFIYTDIETLFFSEIRLNGETKISLTSPAEGLTSHIRPTVL